MSDSTTEAGIDAMKSMQAWQFEVQQLLLENVILRRENQILVDLVQDEIDRSRNHEKWYGELE